MYLVSPGGLEPGGILLRTLEALHLEVTLAPVDFLVGPPPGSPGGWFPIRLAPDFRPGQATRWPPSPLGVARLPRRFTRQRIPPREVGIFPDRQGLLGCVWDERHNGYGLGAFLGPQGEILWSHWAWYAVEDLLRHPPGEEPRLRRSRAVARRDGVTVIELSLEGSAQRLAVHLEERPGAFHLEVSSPAAPLEEAWMPFETLLGRLLDQSEP